MCVKNINAKYIPKGSIVWEPAAGEGNLVKGLEFFGYSTRASDLLTGVNYFQSPAPGDCDLSISNPPYSMKYPWLDKSYELGLPFALLIPIEVIGAERAQRLFDKFGVEIILLDKRINFKMPSHKTWEETLKPTPMWNDDGSPLLITEGPKAGEQKRTSGAQFPVAWFTRGLNIGRELSFEKIDRVLLPHELSSSLEPEGEQEPGQDSPAS